MNSGRTTKDAIGTARSLRVPSSFRSQRPLRFFLGEPHMALLSRKKSARICGHFHKE